MLLSWMVGKLFSLVELPLLIGFVCNLTIMLITYGVTMWAFGFNQQEKKMVKEIIGKLKNRKGK